MADKLIERIKRHEGFSRHVYTCTAGQPTIGFGLNIGPDGFGLDEDLAQEALRRVLADVEQRLIATDWFVLMKLSEPVRAGVVIEMGYQMGVSGVLKFKRMIAAIRCSDWDSAAAEMLDSQWHKQTPKRAEYLADIMRTGDG